MWSGRRRDGVTVLGVGFNARQIVGGSRRMPRRWRTGAWKDLAMTEPEDTPQDIELDPESSTDEPTAETNQEAGEDDVASDHQESGDTY